MNEPDFSRKIRLRQFVATIVLQLHAKFRKDPMTGYREKLRTNGRTDGRTNGYGSIYRTNLQSRWVQKEKNKKDIAILKKRKQLIHGHLEEERKQENRRRVEKTVQEVKEAGGVDSTTFWDVKRRLSGRRKVEVAAILDENGNKHEDIEEIKDVYKRYFKQLLTTYKGQTPGEKRREEFVSYILEEMEKMSRRSPPLKSSAQEIQTIVSQLNIKKAKAI